MSSSSILASLAGMLTREKLLLLVGRMLSPFSNGRKKSSGCGKSWNQFANPVSMSGVDSLPIVAQ